MPISFGMGFLGGTPLLSNTTYGSMHATMISPLLGINPTGSQMTIAWPAYYASSMHAGGTTGLLADGSVQFLSESIDQKVLNALTTMNQNDFAEGF